MTDILTRLDAVIRRARTIDEPVLRDAVEEIKRLRVDAMRYRWIRTAGAWDSEIGMDILSERPEQFDAAVDERMRWRHD